MPNQDPIVNAVQAGNLPYENPDADDEEQKLPDLTHSF